ncbi:MAG TPA: hypothetical protein VMH03_02760 [Terriglobales bacterium]|nr:hypothetical protein [Terriglobales bacterium]
MNRSIVFAIVLAGGWLAAQAYQDQAQQPAKEKPGPVSVQGCVSRSSGDFTLMQSDPGNTYVIRQAANSNWIPTLGSKLKSRGTKHPRQAPARITTGGQLRL